MDWYRDGMEANQEGIPHINIRTGTERPDNIRVMRKQPQSPEFRFTGGPCSLIVYWEISDGHSYGNEQISLM